MNEDRAQAQEFLLSNHVAVLSTVDDDSNPWGSAIYYVADEDFSVLFTTRKGTLKFKNINKQPHVALTIVHSEQQTTLQIAGTISELPVKEYADFVMNKWPSIRPKGDTNWAPPIEKINAGDYIVLKITPTKAQYANYSKRLQDPKDNPVKQII